MKDSFQPDASLIPLLPEREAAWWRAKEWLSDAGDQQFWVTETARFPRVFGFDLGREIK